MAPCARATRKRLEGHGIKVFDLNEVSDIPVYVDGADEIDAGEHDQGRWRCADPRKIVAAVAREFVCICDASKLVDVMGKFSAAGRGHPDGPRARGRQLARLGGTPVLREGLLPTMAT